MEADGEKILLPHHEQQTLCTTRLPYRQGRTLTAVKVYTISKESNHLLIFGVPSLKLRQEIKSHFLKFGKLLQFNISTQHAAEQFTETYHAQYENIQCARIAKKMLDTKNFYGGVLHVCYAPECETLEETRSKLTQRQKDVTNRIRNIQKESISKPVQFDKQNVKAIPGHITKEMKHKLNMGEENTLKIGEEISVVNKKRKVVSNVIEKKFMPCYKDTNNSDKNLELSCIEVVDCTQVDQEVITNVNEHLNYNKFGNEVIRKIPPKPVNRITFNINKKS